MDKNSDTDTVRQSESRTVWDRYVKVVFGVTAAAMSLIHIAQVQYLILPTGLFKTAHLCLGVLVVCLATLSAARHMPSRLLSIVAIALVIAGGGYIFAEYDALIGDRAIFANEWDLIAGIALLLAALYAAWREWGWGIPCLSLGALLYGHFGYLLPGELLFHGGIPWTRLMSYTAIPFFQGLLGGLTELSASTIFIFLFFGAVLSTTGGVDFILEMSRRLGGKSRAGPAQVAVISSGLMGMISGSTVANIASTGSITIPMMKKFGFKPEFAGAVEAAASMGGQLSPPIMGLAAFLIVGLTGVPYSEVMIAAIIPAFIYYAYLMIAVHVRAVKRDIDTRTIEIDAIADDLRDVPWPMLLLRNTHIILGITLLVYLLTLQMPPGLAALAGSAFMLAMHGACLLLFGKGSIGVRLRNVATNVYSALESGGRSGAQVAVILAVIGVLVEVLTVTGFAQKLSGSMLEIADGRPWLLSIIVALACMVFGLGLPTPAAYLLVALLGAPALVETGVPLLAAHFFVFYFANVSALTPPVAIAALVAANIAKAKFLPTALIGIRLSLPAFLLPFLFLAHPQILGLEGGLLDWIVYGLSALVGVVAINAALEGYAIAPLGIIGKVVLTVSGALMLLPGLTSTLIGAGLIVSILLAQRVLLNRGIKI